MIAAALVLAAWADWANWRIQSRKFSGEELRRMLKKG